MSSTHLLIFISIDPDLLRAKGRFGECVEKALWYSDSFFGFKDNKIDMILSGRDIGLLYVTKADI